MLIIFVGKTSTSQAQLQENTFQPASTVLLLVGLIKRRSSANSWERTAKNCGCCVLDSEGVVYQRGNNILNHKLSRRSGIDVRGNYSAANVHVCGVHDEKWVSELLLLFGKTCCCSANFQRLNKDVSKCVR